MRRRIALACLCALLLSACATPAEPESGKEGSLIYFLVPEAEARGGDRIRGSYEDLALEADASVGETARAVVERLLAGSADGALVSPLPENVELVDLEIKDRWAYVDLSSAFNQLSGVDLSLADYCLTLSLTALEDINAVSVTAQGRNVGQQPKQFFYERDVLLSDMDDALRTVQVTLYFLDEEGALAGEERTLEIYEGQTVAENLVAALLAGPEGRDLRAVIPEAFQISFVRMENGACYISLPAASLASLPEDVDQQRLILQSLADSLYSLEAVEELHFVSEGEELTAFGEVPVEEAAARPAG